MTRRPNTVSLSVPDRGQTNQDYVVGIGVFLLAIAFVFAYAPNFVTPFTASVGSAETAQADRLAATIVDNLSDDPERPNHLDADAFEDTYGNETKLVENLSIRAIDGGTSIDRVNVSIEPVDGDTAIDENLSSGPVYRSDQPAASAARIVTVEGRENECDPACRLVVRVW